MTEDTGAPPSSPKQLQKTITGQLNLKTGENRTLEDILNQAARHLKQKKFKAFETEIGRAAELAPQDARVLHFKGLYQFEKQNAIEALKLLRSALQKRPHDTAIQHNMAAVLISLGKFEDAEKLLLSAIALKPDYAEAYHTLAPIRTFKAEDPLITQMKQGLETPNLSDEDITFYAFALAKACDDIGDYETAWSALQRGNTTMPSAYDPQKETTAVDALEKAATRTRLEEMAPYGHQSHAPILIVGMPRSGTTLLESVIADHPQVYAAGELPALGIIGQMIAKNLNIPSIQPGAASVIEAATPEHLYAGGLGYLNAAKKDATGWFDYFTDKLPDNSFNLGLAAALVPNARVIHIMRHPLDTMLSNYFQRFTSVQYAFTPEHIVSHWRNYQRAMAHWREHLPLEMIEIRYENLVQDVDFARSYLWESLGLTLEVAHVPNAQKADNQRTASRWQVRQPVYTSSREKFRDYEAHMSAFVQALGGMAAIDAEVEAQEARCALRQAARN
jgi:tetratricopeptide (TPR) repeat protein